MNNLFSSIVFTIFQVTCIFLSHKNFESGVGGILTVVGTLSKYIYLKYFIMTDINSSTKVKS